MTFFKIPTNQLKFALLALLALMVMACSIDVPSVSPNQAAELFANKQAVIVDVREQDEWNEQHIEGAIFIPLAELENRMGELAQYKDSPIIMQCRTGRRSNIASKSLIEAGFSNVQNLEGGILAWSESGLATVNGTINVK
jgi:rhodanese-related sulfurtransferase